MLEDLLVLVSPAIHERSGSVLYSGRSAFTQPSALYLLGLNPGGDPLGQAQETVAASIQASLSRREEDWSAYVDESWLGRPPGTTRMQPRVQHLLRRLGLDPRRTPSSNVVFVRSAREAHLKAEKASLLAACWPFHQAVIERLGVRAVLCMGGTAGLWVRGQLGAHERIDSFVETNDRRWTSEAHVNNSGQAVITLTHPSVAAWQAPETDPTPLVARVLERVA